VIALAETDEPSCATCRFYEAIEDRFNGEMGRCLRWPPQFVAKGALNGEWPVVRNDKWCGEHAEHSYVSG
jgi:hypothetical protein